MALRAESSAATATRVMAVAAPGMPAASKTAANGLFKPAEPTGTTAAMTKIAPM